MPWEEWGQIEKDWVKKTDERQDSSWLFLQSLHNNIVASTGRFLVILSPVKINLVDYLA